MQITEKKSEGLSREYSITIPAPELEKKLDDTLLLYGQTAKVEGFRPGKIPLNILRARYGEKVFPDAVKDLVQDAGRKIISEKKLTPATQPKFTLVNVEQGKDVEFLLEVELFPEFTITPFNKMKVNTIKCDLSDSAIDKAVEQVASVKRNFVPLSKKRSSKNGDAVKIDFVGYVDGVKQDDLRAEGFQIEIGAGFVDPKFEKAISGKSEGDETEVVIKFPDDSRAKEIAGKEVTYKITIKEVLEAANPEINDETAKSLGFGDLADMRQQITDRYRLDLDRAAFLYSKRIVLDELSKEYKFEIPETMVELEFSNIWANIKEDLEHEHSDSCGHTAEEKAEKKPTQKELEKMEATYRKISERRVRLGLFFAKVGKDNSITVPNDQLSAAIMERVRNFPGDKQKLLDYYRSTPAAVEEIKAPLYEDKVVEFILSQANVTEDLLDMEKFKKEMEKLSADPDI